MQLNYYEGEVCRKLQRYPEAIEAYMRVLELRPIIPSAHSALGMRLSYHRMCSLTIECVLLLPKRRRLLRDDGADRPSD